MLVGSSIRCWAWIDYPSNVRILGQSGAQKWLTMASTAEPNTHNEFIQTPNPWGFSFEGSGKWMKMLQAAQWPFSFLPFSNQTWQWEIPRFWSFLLEMSSHVWWHNGGYVATIREKRPMESASHNWKRGSAFHDDDRQTIISIHINHFLGDDLEMQPIFWETYEHSCCLCEMI